MNVFKVEGRKLPWAVDWRDGERRFRKFFKTRDEAQDFRRQEDARLVHVHGADPNLDAYCTLAEYVPRFYQETNAAGAAETTLTRYRIALDGHILPALGEKRVRDISRADVRSFRLAKVNESDPTKKLAGGTIKHMVGVLSTVLSLAVDDGIIPTNPAIGGRRGRTKAARAEAKAAVKVKAFMAEQAALFLDTARQIEPEAYPAFMLMTHAGLRLGEALGLRWPSVDLQARNIRVHEQLRDTSTKSGTERTVDLSAPLVDLLRDLREASMAAGRRSHVVFPWLSERPDRKEEQKAFRRVHRAMVRVLKTAGLPGHHSPHSCRHTFCSLLIAAGVSPRYVQAQAGHASLTMTVDTYGSWIPPQAQGAMDTLAGQLVTGKVACGDWTSAGTIAK